MFVSVRKLIATAAASAAILALSACGEEPQFDTTVSDAYLECLKSSPAAKAKEIKITDVEERAEHIVIRTVSVPNSFHLSTGSHSTHMLRCLDSNAIAFDSMDEDSTDTTPNGGTVTNLAGPAANHNVYIALHEVGHPDGSFEAEFNFYPIKTVPAHGSAE